MGAQVIRTPAGEELIVLSRRDYDVLLAAAGDEAAEDRMTALLVDEARERRDIEGDTGIPGEIVHGVIDGLSPVRAVRGYVGRSVAELASASGIPEAEVEAIDEGRRDPGPGELSAIAVALGVPAHWLDE